MTRKNSRPEHGFTIIEVIIVLAIAGLMLLVLFLAVPALRASARDTARKSALGRLGGQMDQFKADHGDYPITADQRCEFLKNYAADEANKMLESDCITGTDMYTADYAQATIGGYLVTVHSEGTSHSYMGELDEISIALSHWCNDDPATFGEPPENPITNGHLYWDREYSRYVIWTPLERYRYTCVDNFRRNG